MVIGTSRKYCCTMCKSMRVSHVWSSFRYLHAALSLYHIITFIVFKECDPMKYNVDNWIDHVQRGFETYHIYIEGWKTKMKCQRRLIWTEDIKVKWEFHLRPSLRLKTGTLTYLLINSHPQWQQKTQSHTFTHKLSHIRKKDKTSICRYWLFV